MPASKSGGFFAFQAALIPTAPAAARFASRSQFRFQQFKYPQRAELCEKHKTFDSPGRKSLRGNWGQGISAAKAGLIALPYVMAEAMTHKDFRVATQTL
jgi:hypothetical protein